MEKSPLSSFVLKYSLPIIIVTLLLSIAAGLCLPKIPFDNSVDVFFNKKGDSYLHFQDWKKQFGSDNVVIVAFADQDIFTRENLNLIDSLSNSFESLPYADDVTSLTTVNNITGFEEDFIVEKLIEAIPSDSDAIKRIKSIALNNPLYINNIISQDGKTTAILIELKNITGQGDVYKKETIAAVHKILSNISPQKHFYVSGLTAIEHDFALYMQEDLKTFMPFMLIVISFFLYMSFRSLKIILLPLVAIGVSLSFSMAMLYLFGYSINNITTIIPPILMAIMIADSIHLLAEGIENKGKEKEDVNNRFGFLCTTMNHLFFPCFLTSATTAIGFISLTTSKIMPVKQLGMVVALGVFLALIVTFTFLPALAKQFNVIGKTKKRLFAKKESPLGTAFLQNLGQFNCNHKYLILVGTLILIGISIWGITKIQVETSIIEFFRKDSAIYQATTFVEKNLSGVHPINLSLKSKDYEYFKTPQALNAIEDLTQFLHTIDAVDKITSINDYIKDINQSLHNEDEVFYQIPQSKEQIAQYLLLYGRDDLDDFVDSDWQWATVRVRLKEHSTIKLKGVIKEIEDYLKTKKGVFPDAEVLGQTVLEVETNNSVTDGQLKSLLLAMGTIFCMMFLVFRSIPVGFVSIVPNLLPILINFGIMGFLGIRLNSATSMIAAIGIGIVVDDTIHFLHCYEEGVKQSQNTEQAMYYALAHKGRPIIFTSVILFFGFGILSVSKFVPTSSFGFLSSMLMLSALLADLIVLPSILLIFKPKFRGHTP